MGRGQSKSLAALCAVTDVCWTDPSWRTTTERKRPRLRICVLRPALRRQHSTVFLRPLAFSNTSMVSKSFTTLSVWSPRHSSKAIYVYPRFLPTTLSLLSFCVRDCTQCHTSAYVMGCCWVGCKVGSDYRLACAQDTRARATRASSRKGAARVHARACTTRVSFSKTRTVGRIIKTGRGGNA